MNPLLPIILVDLAIIGNNDTRSTIGNNERILTVLIRNNHAVIIINNDAITDVIVSNIKVT